MGEEKEHKDDCTCEHRPPDADDDELVELQILAFGEAFLHGLAPGVLGFGQKNQGADQREGEGAEEGCVGPAMLPGQIDAP